MSVKYFVIGTSDWDTCDCCGKSSLRKTIVLGTVDEDGNQDLDPHYFGTTCAKKAVGYNQKLSESIARSVKSKDTVRYFSKGEFRFSVIVTPKNSPTAFNAINVKNGQQLAWSTTKELILETEWVDKESIAAKYW